MFGIKFDDETGLLPLLESVEIDIVNSDSSHSSNNIGLLDSSCCFASLRWGFFFLSVIKFLELNYSNSSLVQWLGYLPLTEVARVRFPDGEN